MIGWLYGVFTGRIQYGQYCGGAHISTGIGGITVSERSFEKGHSARPLTYYFALVGLLFVAGCSRGGLELARVEGVVTFNGAPVAEAGVVFSPCESKLGPPASGSTDSEGRFTLVTANGPGAVIGDHQVAISKDQAVVVGFVHGIPQYRTKQDLPFQVFHARHIGPKGDGR